MTRMPILSDPVMEAIAATIVTMIDPELIWFTTLERTPLVRPNMGFPLSDASISFSLILLVISRPVSVLLSAMMRRTFSQETLSTVVLTMDPASISRSLSAFTVFSSLRMLSVCS